MGKKSKRRQKNTRKKRTMDKDGKRQKECERREDFGSGEVTQLPDHVIAERRGQNAAEEESMHIRQRKRTRKRRKGRKKDKRRQETREVSLKASRSCRRAEHRIVEKKTKQKGEISALHLGSTRRKAIGLSPTQRASAAVGFTSFSLENTCS